MRDRTVLCLIAGTVLPVGRWKMPAEGSLMRRPLFTACLCLVIALAIGNILTGADTGDKGGLPPDGSPVRITGRIDTRTSETIILKSISIIQNDQQYSYSGKLQCELTNVEKNAAEGNGLKIGQKVIMEGTFAYFSTASNPGEFDVQAYYAGKGIGGRVRKAQIVATGEDYHFLREKLYVFRLGLHDRLAKVFPDKEASIMQTLLLGEKEALDADVKALYQKNGIAHILSISGLHITLLGMGLYRLLRRLGAPVKVAAMGGAAALVMYGMMVGMSVSASRAIGMYVLRMLGVFVGRTYDMLTGVGLLALLLVLQEPERLGDVSFLMSFGAVLGICMLTPVFAGNDREDNVGVETASGVVAGFGEKKRADGKCGLGEALGFAEKKRTDGKSGFGERSDFDTEQRRLGNGGNGFRVPAWLLTVAGILGDSVYERNKYREGWRKGLYEGICHVVSTVKSGFVASAGVILFTLPIQLWFFYEIPVYSVVLNLLVLPLMSVVMVGGILSLIPGLGIVGTVDCLILWWYEWICERFGELPGAICCVGRPAVWQIVIYYIGIFLLVFGRKYMDEWKQCGDHEAGIDRGTGQPHERDRRCRKMPGGNNSAGDRNREKAAYSEKCSGISPTRWRHVVTKLRCVWRRVMLHSFLHWIAAVMILVLSVGVLTGNFDRGNHVTFLDVGQGDGIVVETAQGAYLFDCGSTSRKKIGEYVLKPYLKSRGIRSLRGAFVSHPDEDHMNGVLELLENGREWGITVEQLFLPAIQEADREEAFADLLVAAETAGVPVRYIKCGDEIRDRRLRLLCLHPEENTTLSDANAYSECFYVEIYAKTLRQDMTAKDMEVGEKSGRNNFSDGVGKLSILLTGDVEGEGERQLTQELLALQKLQEPQEWQKPQESQEPRESQKPQESQESWEWQEPREWQRPQESQEPREWQKPQESQEPQELQEPRELQEPQEPLESQELTELQRQREQGGFKVDILKVAHHGSGYSTSPDFLTAANPTAAVISCGRNNSYGHPHAETLQRLEEAKVPWYCTTDYGALTITADRHGKRLCGYLSGK